MLSAVSTITRKWVTLSFSGFSHPFSLKQQDYLALRVFTTPEPQATSQQAGVFLSSSLNCKPCSRPFLHLHPFSNALQSWLASLQTRTQAPFHCCGCLSHLNQSGYAPYWEGLPSAQQISPRVANEVELALDSTFGFKTLLPELFASFFRAPHSAQTPTEEDRAPGRQACLIPLKSPRELQWLWA